MKAVVQHRYGPPDVLRVEEVPVPVPGEDDVLVKVHAAAVTRTDCGYRAPHPALLMRLFNGLFRPKRRILGSEFAGTVEAVGPNVTSFKAGDRVFGATGFAVGAHAEYVCLPHTGRIAHLPSNLSFAEGASLLEGALYSLPGLRNLRVGPGTRILVYGASGAIGSASVQLAKALGAHVTAVCSARNVETVRSLGPDVVVDYTKEDFTKNGQTYDVIHDAVGKHSFFRCRRSLAPGGTYASSDLGFMWQVPLLALLTWRFGDKRVVMHMARPTQRDVLYLKQLVESGQYRPVVDRIYPIDQVVEATAYVETAKKTGNVVLAVVS